ncbi:hypothetical protein [Fusibacter sp. 3D3]|uniref:hypothetical protein n=1 Tax=Fusibacter sp. 3D3 TaxID=1048380 RepID=UPI000853EBD1|nr:hypothetical protein [Fusibacter sp. 3D3]GAU79132.1 hypothetical protein F3D3_3770 [Fusibacter sp. 3D3]
MGSQSELESIKRTLKKIKMMNYIIFFMLLVLILLGVKDRSKPSTIPEEVVVQKELPAIIVGDDINNLLEDIQKTINLMDSKRVYELLGDYAQSFMTEQDIQKRISDVQYYGDILKIAYSHYQYLGMQDDADWFLLKCVVRFENGNGTMGLYIRIYGDTWEFSGLSIDIEAIESTY